MNVTPSALRNAGLALAAIVLPIVFVSPAAQQPPDDLPAAATRMAAMYATADARLSTCRGHHDTCLVSLQTAAAKLYAVQTAVAPEPAETVAP